MCQGSQGEAAVDVAGIDPDGDLVVAINGMEVRGCMVAVVHRDHDSEEAADFGHVEV
jgi:hypothetical protein